MKKEAKLLRCTLLNGSAWSTERKYMRRYKGKCDIFFEEMEEQFNKESKEGWRFAADAARITDERVGIEIRSTHQEEFLGSSYVNPRKRGWNCPGLGKCAWRYENFRSRLLAHGGMDPKK